MEARRNAAVMEDEGRLRQTGEAGRGFRVTPIGLRRSDKQRLIGWTVASRHRRDRFQFDGIARPRARAMSFDVTDPRGSNPRVSISGAQDLFLTKLARRAHRNAAVTVITDRGAANDGVNAVSVGLGASERLQHNDGRAFAAHVTVAGGIAKLALAVRAKHSRLGIGDRDMRLQNDVGSAGESHLAFAGPNALNGKVTRQPTTTNKPYPASDWAREAPAHRKFGRNSRNDRCPGQRRNPQPRDARTSAPRSRWSIDR